MAHYRIVFADRESHEAQSVEFDGEDAAEALLIAQRHDSPAELWEDGRHICTLHRSGNDGELWIIAQASRKKAAHPGLPGKSPVPLSDTGALRAPA